MAQKDSAYTNMIEELRLKKDIESARCLIESGDLNSARRLLDKSYKHASKTLKGYQQSIERLLEECWKGKVIFGNSISRFVLFQFLGTFQNSVAYPAHHQNLTAHMKVTHTLTAKVYGISGSWTLGGENTYKKRDGIWVRVR